MVLIELTWVAGVFISVNILYLIYIFYATPPSGTIQLTQSTLHPIRTRVITVLLAVLLGIQLIIPVFFVSQYIFLEGIPSSFRYNGSFPMNYFHLMNSGSSIWYFGLITIICFGLILLHQLMGSYVIVSEQWLFWSLLWKLAIYGYVLVQTLIIAGIGNILELTSTNQGQDLVTYHLWDLNITGGILFLFVPLLVNVIQFKLFEPSLGNVTNTELLFPSTQ